MKSRVLGINFDVWKNAHLLGRSHPLLEHDYEYARFHVIEYSRESAIEALNIELVGRRRRKIIGLLQAHIDALEE